MKNFKKIFVLVTVLLCSFNYSNVYSQGVINVDNKEHKADYYLTNNKEDYFARFVMGSNETIAHCYSYDDSLLYSLLKVPDMNLYFIYNTKHDCIGYFKMFTHEGSDYWGKFNNIDELISVIRVGANYDTGVTTGRVVDVLDKFPSDANITLNSSVTTFTEFTFGCFLLGMEIQESAYMTLNNLN